MLTDCSTVCNIMASGLAHSAKCVVVIHTMPLGNNLGELFLGEHTTESLHDALPARARILLHVFLGELPKGRGLVPLGVSQTTAGRVGEVQVPAQGVRGGLGGHEDLVQGLGGINLGANCD